MPDNARRFAQSHSFGWVVRHVFTWWDRRADENLGVGALVWRLNSLGKSKPGQQASDDFRRSEFWRRHYPLDPEQARAWAFWEGYSWATDVIKGGPPPPEVAPALQRILRQIPAPIFDGGGQYES